MSRFGADKRRLAEIERAINCGATVNLSMLSESQKARLEAWRNVVETIALIDGSTAAYEYNLANPLPCDISNALAGDLVPTNSVEVESGKIFSVK